MAVKHIRVKTAWGFGDSIPIVFPGATFNTNYPRILDVKFDYDYGVFAGQPSLPFLGVQFQYKQTPLQEPDSKDFLLRCVKVPSVCFWSEIGGVLSGGFDLNESVFSSIRSRAPVAVKPVFMYEFGTFTVTSDFWVDITYEIIQLTDVQKVQYMIQQ